MQAEKPKNRGWVDVMNRFFISGWAVSGGDEPAEVSILIDGRKCATVAATLFRPDLKEISRDGHCAFQFFPGPYAGNAARVIEVYSDGQILGRIDLAADTPNTRSASGRNPWDSETPYDYSSSWLSAPQYVAHWNAKITGNPAQHWLDYVFHNYIAAGGPTASKSALLLGSNEGHMELRLCELGFIGQIVATDIAAKALARAATRVRERGFKNVTYKVADLNRDRVDGPFDFILCEGVLHHIENIDFCISSLHRSLRPGGLLVGMEYVGPYRFQLSAKEVAWINAALGAMPRGLRPVAAPGDPSVPMALHEQAIVHYTAPSIREMLAFDPSEAVAGHLLRDALQRSFRFIEDKPLGGGVLLYAENHFPFGRAKCDPFVAAWLDVLIKIEDTIHNTGILPHHAWFFVATPSDA